MGKPKFTIPPGWVGGFAQSNPAFAYPDPDLNSLTMLGNLCNIHCLQRQWDIHWPEFSWETDPGDPNSRCFQRFAHDISRIGYTDEGQIYSIICPQQGTCSPLFGCMNVEVTVLNTRGWVDEDTKELAADMTVVGKVWFSPSAMENSITRYLWGEFSKSGYKFPSTKENAIVIKTSEPGNPGQPIFTIRKGQSTGFPIPSFAKHKKKAWTVGHINVEIGEIEQTDDAVVNEFNSLVIEAFNLYSGNLLASGNTLTWNIWCKAPSLVDQQEWRHHAETWRHSIDAGHGSPGGPRTTARYFDKSPFQAGEAAIKRELEKLWKFIESHL